MINIIKKIHIQYLINSSLMTMVFLVIILMNIMQFQVESLQDEVIKTKNEISSFEDEIRILEVEWVYLTRPERLRNIANRYLKNNDYALASQIKDNDEFEKLYNANYTINNF